MTYENKTMMEITENTVHNNMHTDWEVIWENFIISISIYSRASFIPTLLGSSFSGQIIGGVLFSGVTRYTDASHSLKYY